MEAAWLSTGSPGTLSCLLPAPEAPKLALPPGSPTIPEEKTLQAMSRFPQDAGQGQQPMLVESRMLCECRSWLGTSLSELVAAAAAANSFWIQGWHNLDAASDQQKLFLTWGGGRLGGKPPPHCVPSSLSLSLPSRSPGAIFLQGQLFLQPLKENKFFWSPLSLLLANVPVRGGRTPPHFAQPHFGGGEQEAAQLQLCPSHKPASVASTLCSLGSRILLPERRGQPLVSPPSQGQPPSPPVQLGLCPLPHNHQAPRGLQRSARHGE